MIEHVSEMELYIILSTGSVNRHGRNVDSNIYILLWCVSPKFLGDTPLHDIWWCITLVGKLFLVLTYFN